MFSKVKIRVEKKIKKKFKKSIEIGKKLKK